MIGVSFGFHDAAMAGIRDGRVVYASHSERYSRDKNDAWLHHRQFEEAQDHGLILDAFVYYEKPWLKAARQVLNGHPRPPMGIRAHINSFFTDAVKPRLHTVGHHESHAAAGYFTSPYIESAVIVVDAIGEFDCVSIWKGVGRKLTKVWSQSYPHSIGLLYSAFTKRLGLKPNEHEYILMGMAPFGEPIYATQIYDEFINVRTRRLDLRKNVHRGIGNWMPDAKHEDIAASIQKVTEHLLITLFRQARDLTGSANVCYQGGVALNCTANTKLLRDGAFDNYWIMPNPGDAGAALGAVLAYNRDFVEFPDAYLGTENRTTRRPWDVVSDILENGVACVANGRAEFGPRALGNRSILADPRTPAMQNRVNEIKQREEFRPFAPIVLEEHLDDYFETYGADCRFMQYAVPCKRPDEIPAVVHVDGSSRVQTVAADSNEYIRDILSVWHEKTGCPVLLNTSLNIKGQPLVNDMTDAYHFSNKHNLGIY